MAKKPVHKKPAAGTRVRARRRVDPDNHGSGNGSANGQAAAPNRMLMDAPNTAPPPPPEPPTPPASKPRRSTAAVASFIFGLMGYVPIVPGFLAIAFGYIGLVRTRDGKHRGRLLAMAGIAMGILSILAWGVTIEIAMVTGGVAELVSLVWPQSTDGPRAAAEQWLRDLCAGQPQATDAAAAESASAFPRPLFDSLQKQLAALGPLQTFSPIHYHFNDNSGTRVCAIEATATFANGQSRAITIALVEADFIWKVRDCQAR
jgi:hypothetical protein